jgi:hypothetical protein
MQITLENVAEFAFHNANIKAHTKCGVQMVVHSDRRVKYVGQ